MTMINNETPQVPTDSAGAPISTDGGEGTRPPPKLDDTIESTGAGGATTNGGAGVRPPPRL